MRIDRGLAFGDGLFETLKVVGGHAPLADFHWQRLVASARRLDIPCDEFLWQSGLNKLLHQHVGADGVIKLIFTAGAGGRGYARPPESLQPSWYWSWHEYAPRPAKLYQHGMTLALSTVRMARQPALAGMKHLNRLEQVLAFAAKPAGADEVLLGDALGRPLSLSCMNLYARFGDTLWTPDVTQTGAAAGVAGVVRHLILKEWLPASGLVVSHKPCSLSRLCHADEVFASNAVAGVLPISKLGLSGWQAGSACRHFQSCFEQLVK